MPKTKPCPTDETLMQYHAGKLSLERIETVGEHLEQCTACQNRLEKLEQLPPGTLLRNLRGLSRLADSLVFDPKDWAAISSVPHDSGEIELPEKIERYKILGIIGHGGMGIVYEAEHPYMKRPVAVKVIHGKHRLAPEILPRFQQELKTLSQLEHTNIVRAYDAGIVGSEPFLVMERLRGIDLGRFVQQHAPLSFFNASDLILQSAAGLKYAHKLGFVHRDIKPSNLFLTESGVVKLLDFGLAKALNKLPASEKASSFGQTQTGMIVGTCDFIAPEQIEQSGKVDHRADIYSLGCTLYFLLTQRTPYTGSQVAVLASHLRDPFPSVCALRAEIPAAVDELLQRMTAKNPENRINSVDEVIKTLQTIRCSAEQTYQRPFQSKLFRIFCAIILFCIVISGIAHQYNIKPTPISQSIVPKKHNTVEQAPNLLNLPLKKENSSESELGIFETANAESPFKDYTTISHDESKDKKDTIKPSTQDPGIFQHSPSPIEPPRPEEPGPPGPAPDLRDMKELRKLLWKEQKGNTLDPLNDPRNIPKDQQLWNKEMSGKHSCDFMRNPSYSIGEGTFMFEITWSQYDQEHIYLYGQSDSVDGVTLASWAKSPRDIRKASELDFSSYFCTPKIGDLIVLRNQHDKYAVLQITKIVKKMMESLLEFDYYILPEGDDFSTMP